MTISFHDLAGALRAGEAVAAEEVLAARRSTWADGAVSAAEAEALFEINRLVDAPGAEWTDFFVEALAVYVVNAREPRGYVAEADADWLIAQIDRDGRLESHAELELLVKVLEIALNAPAVLKSFALAQIERIVLTGEGPTRRGGALRPGTVDEPEVALLRRILFAGGGADSLLVGRDEAEMLWRLKDATRGADNAPSWQHLFVQALGNHLMAHCSYRPLERAEAQRLEAFMNDRRSSVAGFLGRIAGAIGATIPTERPHTTAEDHERDLALSRAITSGEAAWLRERVDADATLDPLEQALLDFIAES